jgi:hypothetical protein
MAGNFAKNHFLHGAGQRGIGFVAGTAAGHYLGLGMPMSEAVGAGVGAVAPAVGRAITRSPQNLLTGGVQGELGAPDDDRIQVLKP